jgi:periplasmic protein TonB
MSTMFADVEISNVVAPAAWPPRERKQASARVFAAICALHVVVGYWLAHYAPAFAEAKQALAMMVTVSLPSMAAEPVPKDVLLQKPPALKSREAPSPAPQQHLSTDRVTNSSTDSEVLAVEASPSITAVTAAAANATDATPASPFPPASVAARAVQPPLFDADYLNNPAPIYPSLSRRAGEQGRVTLRVHVDASGVADAVEIKDSCGFPRLDMAALEAVRKWKFVAAKQGEQAVAAWVLVPITFSLRG